MPKIFCIIVSWKCNIPSDYGKQHPVCCDDGQELLAKCKVVRLVLSTILPSVTCLEDGKL